MAAEVTRPFQPLTTTANLTVTASAQNLTLARASSTFAQESVLLTNVGTATVFVLFSGTATVSNAIPLIANTAQVFEVPPGTSTISAIGSGTGSVLYGTLGQGA